MKKALVLWSLLLVLALLAGCGSQTADNGNDTPNNDAVTDSQDNVPADNAPVDGPANTRRTALLWTIPPCLSGQGSATARRRRTWPSSW